MKVKEVIVEALKDVTGEKDVCLEFPEREEHGDYSTNVAMTMFAKTKDRKILRQAQAFGSEAQARRDDKVDGTILSTLSKVKSPRKLAEEIIQKLSKDKKLSKYISKIEVAGPGFINFWLSKESLLSEMEQVIDQKDNYGKSDGLRGKKILLEHTSPNTIKTLHLGHVRNNILGMSVADLLKFVGAQVILDAVNNDRGIHVMKAIWAYQKYGDGKTPESADQKPDTFVDQFYIKGSKAYEDDLKVKREIQSLLQRWEEGDSEVRDVWKKLREWTLEGFKTTYQRLGSYHDHQWFESDYFEEGKRIVKEGLGKGVFKKVDDGAVLSQLGKYNLPDTIILRGDGTSMYHTQDLRLTQLKKEKFPSDLYIWDVGSEQSLYLKQLYAMCEQLGIGKRDDYYHLSYGYVLLQGKGKMSSRKGTVISADRLLDKMVERANKIIENSETGNDFKKSELEKIAEMVGIGAIKYGFLKVGRDTDIQFDMDESLALEGNSGPYLQYTFARTQSVLNKAKSEKPKVENSRDVDFNQEEMVLLRSFVQFQDVIIDAAKNYSPNLLCNYLYDLAQKYNNFYNQHRILDPKEASNKTCVTSFRVALTQATGTILKNGLTLLGIKVPERM